MVLNLSNPDVIAAALAQIGPPESFVVEAQAVTGQLVSHFSLAHVFLQTQGSLRMTEKVSLPGNAVLDKLLVKVTAKRADIAYAATVAQLRGEPGQSSTDRVIIVDFGTLRTVARVGFDVECMIRAVEAWNGTEFPAFAYPPFQTTDVPQNPPRGRRVVALNSDIRTQKLRVTVAAEDNVDTLMAGMTLMLPDAPRDLTLKVDGGAPVWSLPGPAVKGPGAELREDAWNENNARLVDLTEVVAAQLGDPLAQEDRTFELLLESAEAGVLAVELHEESYKRVRRAEISGQGKIDRDFAAEGVETVTFTLPGAPTSAKTERAVLSASGQFGLERRLPPVGPDPARVPPPDKEKASLPQAAKAGSVPVQPLTLGEGNATQGQPAIAQPDPFALPSLVEPRLDLSSAGDGTEDSSEDLEILAELTLTQDRAVIFQLDPAGLPGLTGLRLNLTAGGDGAEVSLVPWSGTAGADLPAAALDDLTGDPLTLEANASGWVTLPFAGPVIGPPTPWAALLVTRGSVMTALTTDGAPFRLGPAGGPWRALPLALQTGGLDGLGIACRSVGEVEDPLDPAPVSLTFAGGAPVVFEPNDEPKTITLSAPKGGFAGAPQLTITRLGPGTLTLTNIDVITDI